MHRTKVRRPCRSRKADVRLGSPPPKTSREHNMPTYLRVGANRPFHHAPSPPIEGAKTEWKIHQFLDTDRPSLSMSGQSTPGVRRHQHLAGHAVGASTCVRRTDLQISVKPITISNYDRGKAEREREGEKGKAERKTESVHPRSEIMHVVNTACAVFVTPSKCSYVIFLTDSDSGSCVSRCIAFYSILF